MASVFDQYNQAQQYNLSPDQAMGMSRGQGGGSTPWTNYSPGKPAISMEGASNAYKSLGGLGGGGSTDFGNQMSGQDTPPLQQSAPAQGQESPQQAMAMVTPTQSQQVQWPSYGGGSSGGGGGMDMSSMASIASAFI